MNKYDQITVEERFYIYAYMKEGFCPAEIARILGRQKREKHQLIYCSASQSMIVHTMENQSEC